MVSLMLVLDIIEYVFIPDLMFGIKNNNSSAYKWSILVLSMHTYI